MNIIIQLKVQNHRNTFDATLTTVLHRLSFQMHQKMTRENLEASSGLAAKTRENLEASYIALRKPDLKEQRDFERLVLFKNGVT